jgi:hypothetical protein
MLPLVPELKIPTRHFDTARLLPHRLVPVLQLLRLNEEIKNWWEPSEQRAKKHSPQNWATYWQSDSDVVDL